MKEIQRIKSLKRVLCAVLLLLLCVNAFIWFFTLIRYYDNNRILFTVGLGCVAFLVASIIVGVLIDKRINKHLKGFVENFAGAVNDEDKKIADTLYKKWKKHYLRSIKIILNEFREETYPFGNKILEDLRSVKKGLKVEMSSFYTQLSKGNDGEAANRLLLEIVKLIEKNSYTI